MALDVMTPGELDKLLATARKHKVLAFEVGALKVSFSPAALEDVPKGKPRRQAEAEAPSDEDLLDYYSTEG